MLLFNFLVLLPGLAEEERNLVVVQASSMGADMSNNLGVTEVRKIK